MKLSQTSSRLMVLSLLGLIALVGISVFLVNRNQEVTLNDTSQTATNNRPCTIETQSFTVQDESLQGIKKPGDSMPVLWGYYSCNTPKRGDVVIHKVGGYTNTAIKIVEGIPGDKVSFEKSGEGWLVAVNGSQLNNPSGTPYVLTEQDRKLLVISLGEQSTIGKDKYLVFGVQSEVIKDRAFTGLLDITELIGRIKID